MTRQDLRLSLGVRLGQGPTVGQYFCDAAGLVPAGRGARSVENTQSVTGQDLSLATPPANWLQSKQMNLLAGLGSGFLGFRWASCAGWQRIFADRLINVLAALAGSFALHCSGTSGLWQRARASGGVSLLGVAAGCALCPRGPQSLALLPLPSPMLVPLCFEVLCPLISGRCFRAALHTTCTSTFAHIP